MTDNLDRIVAKVKKMLATANDSAASETERDTAMRMVHATLAKYNMSMSSLKEEERDKRLDSFIVTRDFPWMRSVGKAIGLMCFCKMFVDHNETKKCWVKHVFIGRESNVITAQGLTQYVIASIVKEANKRTKEEFQNGTYHRSFCKGAAHAIFNRCAKIRADAERESKPISTGTSLVLASVYAQEKEANNAYLTTVMGIKLKSNPNRQRNTAASAHTDGMEFGSKVSLHNQIGNSSRPVAGRLT